MPWMMWFWGKRTLTMHSGKRGTQWYWVRARLLKVCKAPPLHALWEPLNNGNYNARLLEVCSFQHFMRYESLLKTATTVHGCLKYAKPATSCIMRASRKGDYSVGKSRWRQWPEFFIKQSPLTEPLQTCGFSGGKSRWRRWKQMRPSKSLEGIITSVLKYRQ